MKSLGPLPTVTAGHVLQEESMRALRAALPAAEYVFRDEWVGDYGVDGSIEIVVDGRATNMRSRGCPPVRLACNRSDVGDAALEGVRGE